MHRASRPLANHGVALFLAFSLFLIALAPGAQGQTLNILYDFHGGLDGSQPTSTLVMDTQGNLYGTAQTAGASGAGTVFEVAPSGAETVLYAFTGGKDGDTPYAGVVFDTQGNLYGTTLYGGSTACGATGCGVVFKVTPAGQESVVYAFAGGSDGFYPRGTLIIDSQGNLYGTTQYGGAPGSFGTVFKISPSGAETVLYRFGGYPSDGAFPFAGVTLDAQGNLYGTTEAGGKYGVGTVFELASAGAETILHTFSGGADAYPWAAVSRDNRGNLYGTATGNFGEVFALSPAGKETIVYTFTGGADGGFPLAGLLRDSHGNFYSTTSQGGTFNDGTIFKLARVNKKVVETVIYNFAGMPDGAQPYAGLIGDSKGNGYGTTLQGGSFNHGTVFQITP